MQLWLEYSEADGVTLGELPWFEQFPDSVLLSTAVACYERLSAA